MRLQRPARLRKLAAVKSGPTSRGIAASGGSAPGRNVLPPARTLLAESSRAFPPDRSHGTRSLDRLMIAPVGQPAIGYNPDPRTTPRSNLRGGPVQLGEVMTTHDS